LLIAYIVCAGKRNNCLREARLRTYADAINGRIGLYVVLFVLFIICQILTGSRAGTVFTFAGLLVCLLLFAGRSRRMGMGGGTFVSLALMLVIATVVLLELSGARFVDQIARQGLEDSSRMEVYAQSLSAIRDYLLSR
jgi:O-antigen ligase